MSKHSKLPWRLMEITEADLLFIQADKNKPKDPYHIEVIGEDTNDDLYPLEQKNADAQLIVRAVNNHDRLVEALGKIVRTAPIGLGGWDALLEAKQLLTELKQQ